MKKRPTKAPRAVILKPPVAGTVDGSTLFEKVDSLSMSLNLIDDITSVVGEALRSQDCDIDGACANLLHSVFLEIEKARKALGDVSQMVPRGKELENGATV